MNRRIFASLLLCALAGCGPLTFPMVQHLDPEDQHRVDQMWDNMLTPINRTDRETLLDCTVLFAMQQVGVDEFHSRSIKYTHAGRVEMNIDFDRDKPTDDRFKIRVIRNGRTIRQEQYTYEEVFMSVKGLTGWPGEEQATTAPTTEASEKEQEFQRRIDRVTAATQPALGAPNPAK